MEALNAHIRPYPIAVLSAEEVGDQFHARFSCHGRSYLYRVQVRRAPAALRKNRVWRIAQELDVPAMQAASACLIGKHDFTTFRSAQCQADSPIRSMGRVDVKRVDDEVHFELEAISFLHNQVRSLVGSLVQVGLGRWPVDQMEKALKAADRTQCGPVAPAQGLYFVKASYPEDAV